MSFKKIKNLFSVLKTASVFLVLILFYQNCSESYKAVQNVDSGTADLNSNSETSNAPPVIVPPVSSPPGTPPSTNPIPLPTPNKVGVFVASGHMARTVISCDDGRTWIHDQSANNAARCWVDGDPNYVECDHTPYSGVGLEYNDDWFFASFGWGFPGSLRRSQNGRQWQVTRNDTTASGLAYVNSILFLNWQNGFRSLDQGTTWMPVASRELQSLSFPTVSRVNSLMIATGRDDRAQRFAISRDQGATWTLPSNMQSGWIKKVAGNASRIVAIGHNGSTISYSATSTDNGVSWVIREQSVRSVLWEQLVFDGEKFISWGNGQRWISFDGLNWMGQPFVVENIGNQGFNGPIQYNPTTKTLVMITNNWGNYYNNQKAYRSVDGGLTWTLLNAVAFRGGHPIKYIVFGNADISACSN